MPNRMLRDWTDSVKMKAISVNAERFFVRLIMKADDYGCYHGDASLLKANLFPYLLDSIREADLLRWMAECQKAGLIVLYESNGKKYVHILDFRQRLDKASSKFPLPKSTDLPETVNGVPEVVNGFRAELELEVEKEKRTNTGRDPAPRAPAKVENGIFIKPSLEEVKSYFLLKIGNSSHPNHWMPDKCSNQADRMFDHYEANGWMQGKGKPVMDWRAACRNWIRRALAGEFDPRGTPKRELPTPSTQGQSRAPQELTAIQTEINYLFCRWKENSELVTVISITSDHYNFLKSSRMLHFNSSERGYIVQQAEIYMQTKGLEGDIAKERLLKSFGVLEFFRQLSEKDIEEVFKPEKKY